MNFVQSIKDGFARCFDFSGRSSRRQFWFFYLFHELATSIAFIIDNVLGLSLHKMPIAEVNLEPVYISFGPIFIFTSFLLLIPFFAAKVRRFHDVGKSGNWVIAQYLIIFLSFLTQFLSLVLLMLTIYLIIFWCLKGEDKQNNYGELIN